MCSTSIAERNIKIFSMTILYSLFNDKIMFIERHCRFLDGWCASKEVMKAPEQVTGLAITRCQILGGRKFLWKDEKITKSFRDWKANYKAFLLVLGKENIPVLLLFSKIVIIRLPLVCLCVPMYVYVQHTCVCMCVFVCERCKSHSPLAVACASNYSSTTCTD